MGVSPFETCLKRDVLKGKRNEKGEGVYPLPSIFLHTPLFAATRVCTRYRPYIDSREQYHTYQYHTLITFRFTPISSLTWRGWSVGKPLKNRLQLKGTVSYSEAASHTRPQRHENIVCLSRVV